MDTLVTEFHEIEKFSNIIEEMVEQGNTYLESIVEYCQDNDMEIELVVQFISPAIKSKLKIEAERVHLLKPPTSRRISIL